MSAYYLINSASSIRRFRAYSFETRELLFLLLSARAQDGDEEAGGVVKVGALLEAVEGGVYL